MPSSRMIRQHQLRVDDEPLLELEGGLDPQHPIGAAGAVVDVGDRPISKSRRIWRSLGSWNLCS